MTKKIPDILYLKVHKSDLRDDTPTISDTGLSKKFYFEDPNDKRLEKSVGSDEIIVGAPISAFVSNPIFTLVEEGVWENCSPVLSRSIYNYKSHNSVR